MVTAIKKCGSLLSGFTCDSCKTKESINNFDEHLKKHDKNEKVKIHRIVKYVD